MEPNRFPQCALAAPFSPTLIHWRIGSTNRDNTKGMPLAYVDARDVIERLDSAVGPFNWQNRYPFEGCCEIGIYIGSAWIWKANGAGKTKIEAEKGQYSDAFKRAGVMWGIARYLYDLPNIWVEIEARGKSYALPKTVEADLTQRLEKWQRNYFKEESDG